MFGKKDKETKKKNSMVDVGQESTRDAKNIFKLVVDGIKETIKTLKEGDRSVKKMPTSSAVLIGLLLLLMLYFVISTIFKF